MSQYKERLIKEKIGNLIQSGTQEDYTIWGESKGNLFSRAANFASKEVEKVYGLQALKIIMNFHEYCQQHNNVVDQLIKHSKFAIYVKFQQCILF
ncbi:unnamed protein product [Paramecium octaurelia]|uniref:Uncharacterized protein n=1 Tax=Paramecium octaurelia TaxID=43137 RepID=A0A8S1WQK9_PAROT|nr:unnamed protein product [Paramecium octaurelia]